MAGTTDDTATGPVPGRPAGAGTATPPGSRRAARRAPPPRPDASMTLLREVMERPLDLGYEAAAARRAAGLPARGRAVTTVVAVAAGLAVTWSVTILRAPEPSAVRARALLQDQIEQRTRDNDAAVARMDGFRRDIRRAQNSALTRSGDTDAVAEAVTLGVLSGEVSVTGPGLRLELDDAAGSRAGAGADANPRGGGATDNGRVYDRDLQTVVNGLWNAGAEAIAINEQRLTSLSAIRSAGEAILVDFRPLVPPYVIVAVGDPRALQTRFAADAGGAYLQSLAENFGVRVRMDTESELVLKGSGSLLLRNARPLDGQVSGSSTTGSTTGGAAGAGSRTSSDSGSEGTP